MRFVCELITFYIGNDAGIYVADGVAKEQLKASASFATKLDKLKDGVITISKPLFGKNTTTEFGYEWTTAGGESVSCAARISLNGATAIKGVSDGGLDGAAKAEYFDLQGMRVDTPQRGQVYIMRKGHSVSKIIK